MSELSVRLSKEEQEQYDQYNRFISKHLQTFVDVGLALARVRDGRLYRAEFKTFEDYCQRKWQLKGRRAYQMIDAAEVVSNLAADEPKAITGSVNHGTQTDLPPKISTDITPPLPATERQARPLAKLPPQEQREAWQEAVETAPEGKVTAKHVEQTVKRITARTTGPMPTPASVAEAVSQASAARANRHAPIPKPGTQKPQPARNQDYEDLQAAFLDLFSFAAEVKPLAAMQDRRVLVNAGALSDLREAVNRANKFKLEVLGKD